MYDVHFFNYSHSSEGKPIPTELRKDEAALRKAIEFDDENHERKYMQMCAFYSLSIATVLFSTSCIQSVVLIHSVVNPSDNFCQPCPHAGTEGGFN